jgi:16S rRNA (guanine(966)-N(2))-methyltransferase RsmD
VIAGENRGRALKTVSGRMTRPTTDKVKESLFNMIGPYFNEGSVLDLYGGSGGLGIEALSRGADSAVFVDRAAAACRIISENVVHCGYSDRSRIYRLDALMALEKLAENGYTFDYIFLDPPYAKEHLVQDIERLLSRNLLNHQASIIAEHDVQVSLPESFGEALNVWKHRTYQGRTAITIYQFKKDNQGSDSL